MGFVEGGGIDELFAVPFAVVELQADPFGEIAGAGGDSTGGSFGVGFADEAVDRLSVNEDVQRGLVGAVFVVGEARAGGGHAEAGVELLVGDRLPRLAQLDGGGDGSGGVTEVAIGIRLAERAGQREITHAIQNVGAGIAEVFEEVAGFGGESAAVGEKVADSDLLGGLGIRELEVGIEVEDLVVPMDFAFAYQRRKDSRGNGFRERCDLKNCVGIDWRRVSDFADAIAAHKEDLVVVDDSDRDSGNLGAGESSSNVGFELSEGGVYALGSYGRAFLRQTRDYG